MLVLLLALLTGFLQRVFRVRLLVLKVSDFFFQFPTGRHQGLQVKLFLRDLAYDGVLELGEVFSLFRKRLNALFVLRQKLFYRTVLLRVRKLYALTVFVL